MRGGVIEFELDWATRSGKEFMEIPQQTRIRCPSEERAESAVPGPVPAAHARVSEWQAFSPSRVIFLVALHKFAKRRLGATCRPVWGPAAASARSASSGLPRPDLSTVSCMAGDRGLPVRRVKDAHGHSWRIGTDAEVAWIARGTYPGLAITAAIPPVFDAYATIVLPEGGEDRERHNQAMLALLEGEPAGQRWWLGYLSSGADHLVFPGVTMAALPKVRLYAEWDYVLVEAGPKQAATWRRNGSLWWRDVLPDLIFPADRSWLVTTLCDDDWTCLGGPASLVGRFLAHPDLQARPVQLREDATPPGHRAF
jgi:hypothetical protein